MSTTDPWDPCDLVEPGTRRCLRLGVGSGIKIAYANANTCGWAIAKTPRTSLVLFVYLAHFCCDPWADPSPETSPWVEFLSWFHAKDDLPFSFFLFCFFFVCACLRFSCGFRKRERERFLLFDLKCKLVFFLIEIWASSFDRWNLLRQTKAQT